MELHRLGATADATSPIVRIFGQFQAGVCSVFGLRYRLLETIPKHGGDHCRVELTPLRLRRSVDRGSTSPIGRAGTPGNSQ